MPTGRFPSIFRELLAIGDAKPASFSISPLLANKVAVDFERTIRAVRYKMVMMALTTVTDASP
jgi:hypothetical protein